MYQRGKTISSANQCKSRWAIREQHCPSLLYSRVNSELKTYRLFVPFHHSNKENEKKRLPPWVMGLIIIQQPTGFMSWPFKFLTKPQTPNSPTCTAPSSFDVCQSQRKETTNSVFFWIYLWPGFLRASERIGETLIARHLTYPFPQLDVQPCATDGKSLSEGHRLGMQLAGSALVLYCWPSYLGLLWSVECPSARALSRQRVEQRAAASHQPPGPQLHGSLILDPRRLFAFVTRNMPNSLFTSTSSAAWNKWMKP